MPCNWTFFIALLFLWPLQGAIQPMITTLDPSCLILMSFYVFACWFYSQKEFICMRCILIYLSVYFLCTLKWNTDRFMKLSPPHLMLPSSQTSYCLCSFCLFSVNQKCFFCLDWRLFPAPDFSFWWKITVWSVCCPFQSECALQVTQVKTYTM